MTYDEDFFDESFLLETRDHSIDSQIDLIMRSFPFDKVHKIFSFMDYKYIHGLTEEYLPTQDDIMFLTKNILESAGKKGKKMKTNMTVSSGRFEAVWNNDEETLSLKFIHYENEIMVNASEETIFVV